MPEPVATEKLQPCLLDRLTDDDPTHQEESRNQRVISPQRYLRGVLRDLQWIFNASAAVGTGPADDAKWKKFPEARRSVINFGVQQICGLTAPDFERLQGQLAEAIEFFEPRILTRTLSIRVDAERNLLTFELDGELWANPVPEHLHLKTIVDVETGQCSFGDSSNG
jgi:type VI secretion system protein ImpF